MPAEDGDLVALGHLAGGALVVTEQDDAFEVGHVLVVEHGGIVDAEKAAHREQGTGARPVEHIGGLGALEAGVERHQGRARAHQPQGGHDPFGHVGGPDGHAVAGVDARRHGRPGHLQRVAPRAARRSGARHRRPRPRPRRNGPRRRPPAPGSSPSADRPGGPPRPAPGEDPTRPPEDLTRRQAIQTCTRPAAGRAAPARHGGPGSPYPTRGPGSPYPTRGPGSPYPTRGPGWPYSTQRGPIAEPSYRLGEMMGMMIARSSPGADASTLVAFAALLVPVSVLAASCSGSAPTAPTPEPAYDHLHHRPRAPTTTALYQTLPPRVAVGPDRTDPGEHGPRDREGQPAVEPGRGHRDHHRQAPGEHDLRSRSTGSRRRSPLRRPTRLKVVVPSGATTGSADRDHPLRVRLPPRLRRHLTASPAVGAAVAPAERGGVGRPQGCWLETDTISPLM